MYAPVVERTGFCPDHPHIRLARVPGSEQMYQCPLDGKVYDFARGFELNDGTFVNGNSVANQIPDWMGNKY